MQTVFVLAFLAFAAAMACIPTRPRRHPRRARAAANETEMMDAVIAQRTFEQHGDRW